MNTTNIRQAILMAADKIERFPEQFDFGALQSPAGPDGCGCALGWIGYFAGERGEILGMFVYVLLGVYDGDFYRRMNRLERMGECWMAHADHCAACLRRYVDAYYPAEPEQPWLASYLRRLSVAGESGQYVGDVA